MAHFGCKAINIQMRITEITQSEVEGRINEELSRLWWSYYIASVKLDQEKIEQIYQDVEHFYGKEIATAMAKWAIDERSGVNKEQLRKELMKYRIDPHQIFWGHDK